jgi:hypothetical protein
MNILKKQKIKDSFKNYWLQKSEQKKSEKAWEVKLEELAKFVTNFIKGK